MTILHVDTYPAGISRLDMHNPVFFYDGFQDGFKVWIVVLDFDPVSIAITPA